METTNPQISIIIPIYNVEDYLPRCIESILAQTFVDFELLLVDDGSTDTSKIICDEYAVKNERIKILHKKNAGVSSARNLGLENAKGNYIWFVDADDYIEKDSLYLISKIIKESDEDIYEFAFNRNGKKCSIAKKCINLKNNSDIMRFYLSSPKFHLWNKVIKKKSINSVRFIEGIAIGEDYLFLSSIFDNANTYLYSDITIYNYFDGRIGSAMTSLNNYVKKTNINQIFRYLNKNKLSFKQNNYAALPSVFINRNNFLNLLHTHTSNEICRFIKMTRFIDIIKANCTHKQKLYLIIYKIRTFISK